MFEYQLCEVRQGNSLTFSTTIPMIYLGVVLRRIKPLSIIDIRAYFLIIFFCFTVWAVLVAKSICQPDLTFLNIIILAVWNSGPSLIVALMYYHREFRKRQ